MEFRKSEPVFTFLEQIQPGQQGYNVYAKIINLTKSQFTNQQNQIIDIADCLIGDETALANARFNGSLIFQNLQDIVSLIGKNTVIAIRNGRSDVFNEKIRLEIDKFGKVTIEDNKIIKSVNTNQNISDVIYEKKYV